VRDRRDQVELDQPVGQQAQRPALPALGRVRAGQRDQVHLDVAVHLAGRARRRLRLQGGVQALLDEALPHALDGAHAEAEGLGDLGVGLAGGLVGVEQHVGVGQGAGGGLALSQELLQVIAFLRGQGYDVLLHGCDSFRPFAGRHCRPPPAKGNLTGY
jgi:hypothetical protein